MEKIIHAEVHRDPSTDEWVLRLCSNDGSFMSLGSLNGEPEARVVQSVLQGAIELAYQRDEMVGKDSFYRGMSNANEIVGGRGLIDFVLKD